MLPVPSVSMTALRFVDPNVYWGLRAGIAFELPILSLNRGKIAEQVQLSNAASAQVQAARERLTGQVRASRARWAAAASRASFYGGGFLVSAQRILEMARAGYSIGRTSLVAVLQAQSDLSSARGKSIDAALEAQRALADLEEASGADL